MKRLGVVGVWAFLDDLIHHPETRPPRSQILQAAHSAPTALDPSHVK